MQVASVSQKTASKSPIAGQVSASPRAGSLRENAMIAGRPRGGAKIENRVIENRVIENRVIDIDPIDEYYGAALPLPRIPFIPNCA